MGLGLIHSVRTEILLKPGEYYLVILSITCHRTSPRYYSNGHLFTTSFLGNVGTLPRLRWTIDSYSNLPQCEVADQGKLPDHGNTLLHHQATTCTNKPGWAASCRIATAAVVLLIIASAGFVLGSIIGTASGAQIDDCGETPAQARANGCRYDPMIQMWVPVACHDEEHSEMYLSTYKWKWYYDLDATHEISDEVMRLGEHQVAFMADDYHRRHCAYVWEVSARALQHQRPLTTGRLAFLQARSPLQRPLTLSILEFNLQSTRLRSRRAQGKYGRCAPYFVWVDGWPK